MAMSPEEIAAQIAAQQAAQAVQLQQQKEAVTTATPATPAKTSAVLGPSGGPALNPDGSLPRNFATMLSPSVTNAITPVKAFTPASGMPETAMVTSVGYAPTGSAGGGGGSAASSGGGEEMTPEGAIEENIVVNKGLEQVAPSNPLAREGGVLQNNLDAAAQNYRNLVSENASPDERNVAKQQYADALNQKATAVGNQPRTVSQAFGEPQRPPDAKVAKYNAYLVRQGINPFTIGGAKMTEAGGLNVPTIGEETAAISAANQAAKTLRDFQAQEHQARVALKEAERSQGKKGAKEGAKEAAQVALNEASDRAYQFGIESGAIDPRNPTAGMNRDKMVQTALMKLTADPDSLAGRAQKQIEESAVAQQKKQSKGEEKPVEKTQQELADMAARNRIANELWLEEQRRRQQEALGNLYAANY